MKYGNEMDVCRGTECTMPAPQECLMERMFATAILGSAVRDMTERIQSSLFGRGESLNQEKQKEPECFVEVLERHRVALADTARALEEICARLGA